MSRALFPFRQFVLKVHSRCDLACNHCYVYEHADQTWRGRPLELSRETAALVARRIAEHAAEHGLGEVRVVLHGGEPLLLGVRRFREVLDLLRRKITADGVHLDLRVHTNGVLLDADFLDLFVEYSVKIGVSLDGDKAANDRHRLYRDGRSSYDKVVKALNLLREPQYRELYVGLLCTIDIENDPLAVYRGLLEHEPPRIDLLLPHSTWDAQPPGLRGPRSLDDPGRADGGASPEYARWLRKIFDVWNETGRPVPVRIFDSVIAALHGRPSQTESLGLVPADLVVIETDGTIEQVDSLKTAFHGAPATGLDVRRHSFTEAASHAGITARQHGLAGLSATCRACSIAGLCGGGLYAHRYASGTGFDNPSVYCADLTDLITYISAVEISGPSLRATREIRDIAAHSLRHEDVEGLAAGYGDAEAIQKLAEAQRSIVRSLLAKIASTGPQYDRTFTTAWDKFAELDEQEPDAVDEVLAHPYVRTWAVECIERLEHGDKADFDYLNGLGASITARANRHDRFVLPLRDGLAYLPTFGAIAGPSTEREAVVDILFDGWAEIQIGNIKQRIKLDLDDESRADEDPPSWRYVRRLRAEGLSVVIEDTDPYRSCHRFAAPRLTSTELSQWHAALPAAMAYIDQRLPRYAPGLRSGLRVVMPMTIPDNGTHRSAAARHAFGAVGAALPDDPALLALLLVHEFQHVKLGAVLDLYTLYDDSDTAARHYAPWRPDPRPLEALLQGTYAHVAVAEFWRVHRTVAEGPGAILAETQFARWRMHTAEAIDQLLDSDSLTQLGKRFAHAMHQTVAPWLDEPVSAEAEAAAREASRRHRAAFEANLAANSG